MCAGAVERALRSARAWMRCEGDVVGTWKWDVVEGCVEGTWWRDVVETWWRDVVGDVKK